MYCNNCGIDFDGNACPRCGSDAPVHNLIEISKNTILAGVYEGQILTRPIGLVFRTEEDFNADDIEFYKILDNPTIPEAIPLYICLTTGEGFIVETSEKVFDEISKHCIENPDAVIETTTKQMYEAVKYFRNLTPNEYNAKKVHYKKFADYKAEQEKAVEQSLNNRKATQGKRPLRSSKSSIEQNSKGNPEVSDHRTFEEDSEPDNIIKKILPFIAIGVVLLLIVVIFAFCNNKESNQSGIVDAKVLNTDITLPAEIVSISGMKKGDDLSAFISEGEFIGAKWNDDGSITYTMSNKAFKEYKEQLFSETKADLEALAASADHAYITKLSCSDDLRNIEVTVVKSDYEENVEFGIGLEWNIGLTVPLTQAFTGETPSCDVIVIDESTGTKIEEIHFPTE